MDAKPIWDALNLAILGGAGGLTHYLIRCLNSHKRFYCKSLIHIWVSEMLIGASLGAFLTRLVTFVIRYRIRQNELEILDQIQILIAFSMGLCWRPVYSVLHRLVPRMVVSALTSAVSHAALTAQEIIERSAQEDEAQMEKRREEMEKREELDQTEE